MYKIAVMGDRDSIYGFAALGSGYLSLSQTRPRQASKLRELAEGEYAVIYITEALAAAARSESWTATVQRPARHYPDPRRVRQYRHGDLAV